MRPESETSRRKITSREREAQALHLRRDGKTYAEIALSVGYRFPSSVRKAVLRAMDRFLPVEEVEELRRMEAERLSALQARIWPMAMDGDLLAVDRILKIMARRARLLGLDAPARAEISGQGGGPIDIVSILMEKRQRGELDPMALAETLFSLSMRERDRI